MPAIKVTNSSNFIIKNSKFYGFETDIELENVEGFLSENNQFSRDNNPVLLLEKLSDEISKSKLDDCLKQTLSREIIETLSSRKMIKEEEVKIKNYIGDKAVDIFTQLVAAVLAGLIIKP
ncbi:MAG TPA: hypothetical protein PLD14_01395 [Candidatus Pacearchaeota archaeon]|nr:hypothetical protein [Candidatus Pacearchaeota archaeon]HPR79854.1 hypothetical protein [Candidatus Pacearchaeota archaeon]